MLITALSLAIGYDKASKIAHLANDESLSLKKAAPQSGDIEKNENVDPPKMVRHRVGGR
jgi:fumarate hydratase, class II